MNDALDLDIFTGSLSKNNWGEYSITPEAVSPLNSLWRDLQAQRADTAVLIEAMLRKDAEVDELRALVAALERRVIELEEPTRWTVPGVVGINIPPVDVVGPFRVTYSSNTGGGDGSGS